MRLAAVRVRARDETLRGKRARRGGALWGFGYVGCEGRTRGEISVEAGAFFFSSSATSGSWRVAPRALLLRAPRSRHAPVSCHARSDCCAGSPSRTAAWTWWRSAVVSGSKRRRRRAPRTARVAPRSAAADAREMKSSSGIFSTWPRRFEAPRSCDLPDSQTAHTRAHSRRGPRARLT